MDTRARILQAAGKLFGEAGYNRTSTRAIAAAAGVNEVTLFRHFGSKANLLKAFMEAMNAEGFAATFEQALTGDYRADIALMARAQLDDTLRHLRLLRVMVCDMADAPEMRAIALQGARGNYERLAGYFRRQIEAGVVRKGFTPEALTDAFNGLFSTALFVQFAFDANANPFTDAYVRQLCDLFVEGTLRR